MRCLESTALSDAQTWKFACPFPSFLFLLLISDLKREDGPRHILFFVSLGRPVDHFFIATVLSTTMSRFVFIRWRLSSIGHLLHVLPHPAVKKPSTLITIL